MQKESLLKTSPRGFFYKRFHGLKKETSWTHVVYNQAIDCMGAGLEDCPNQVQAKFIYKAFYLCNNCAARDVNFRGAFEGLLENFAQAEEKIPAMNFDEVVKKQSKEAISPNNTHNSL
jgi:hypothetical protein